ncbi:TetR family transcriptional regulator [Gordonia sp. ABSL11-1]|uniref:TetR/AcrR family transcriptional regulator n=1 Tax=Gordonia sp. ABSL11-1 TaxID=3053924 RepID=UPI0025741BE9|nr:TetR family transcriptional regulator [Gordonia sp. ABSL11-1]MDL9946237.1 TetR family transcriptional regulator [Gordonia sp. ABSL11-1]
MPRQIDHDARRATIDAAVITIAAESGFAAVTIRAVAQRIGSSTSAVTHYVSSREELLGNAVRREVDARLDEADAAIGERTGNPALRALVEWAMFGAAESGRRFWLAAVLGAEHQPVLRAELERFTVWWDARVRALLTQAGVEDPQAASDVLNVVIDGLVVSSFYGGSPWVDQRREGLLDTVWRALAL